MYKKLYIQLLSSQCPGIWKGFKNSILFQKFFLHPAALELSLGPFVKKTFHRNLDKNRLVLKGTKTFDDEQRELLTQEN